MTLRLSSFCLLALFATFFLVACELLVSPGDAPIKCKIDDKLDPCPKGMSCIDDVCKTWERCEQESCEDGIDNDCDHKVDEHDDSIVDGCNQRDDDCDGEEDEDAKKLPESCNGADDNCNNVSDEDESFDLDGDGFTICGKSGKFLREESDCEPDDKNSHPGQKEECDGLNNDCDRDTDEGATCPGDQLCRNGSCVQRSCAIMGSGKDCAPGLEVCVNGTCEPMDCTTKCGDKQFCDKASNTCKDLPQPKKNGDGCAVDSDCQSSQCVDSAAFSLPASAPKRVCAQSCCSDSNCTTPGEGCFISAAGARSCLPRTLVQNVTAPLGSTAAATCTANSDCPMGSVCAADVAYQGATRVATTVCRRPMGVEQPAFQQCAATFVSEKCNTRMCMPLILSEACTAPCRVNADCSRFQTYNAALRGFCQYLQLSDYGSVTPGYYAPVCIARLENESSTPNTCRTSNECPDGACLGASQLRTGRCSPTCCNDTHCAALGDNSHCVPVARGAGRFEMRCTVPQ